MPNERVSMSKLKQLIALQASNLSVRAIARTLGSRPVRSRGIYGAVRAAGISPTDAETLPESELEERVFGPGPAGKPPKHVPPDFSWVHTELKRACAAGNRAQAITFVDGETLHAEVAEKLPIRLRVCVQPANHQQAETAFQFAPLLHRTHRCHAMRVKHFPWSLRTMLRANEALLATFVGRSSHWSQWQ